MTDRTIKRSIAIVTACMTASGSPTFVLNEVRATPDEIDNGLHYALAETLLLADDYEEPFVHFDVAESPAFLHPCVRAMNNTDSEDADEPVSVGMEEPSCPA